MTLPELLFTIVSFILNLTIVLFLIYYLLHLRTRTKQLEQKEQAIDANYHRVVDDALSRERKILDDATAEANHILTDAKYVNASSQKAVDQSLQTMVTAVEKQAGEATHDFEISYQTSLKQLTTASLTDFQTITKTLQSDLQKQLATFHNSLLPAMQKELEEYKKSRMQQTEQTITKIVQEASIEMLNKSLSFDDQHKLLAESLEKAKKQGLFD